MRTSRTGIIVSASPGLLALGLFYSLAIHMHRSLGGWPSGIGEAGFPPALLAHATIATSYFWILLLLSIFTLPVAILVCLLVPRWRHLVPYFALYALVFIVSIVLMQLAPEQYLYWWRD
jgi:NADH:ubiquinone oxidoreductase subunit 3 (subunit A)